MAELIINSSDKKKFLEITNETIGGLTFNIQSGASIAVENIHLLDNHLVTIARYLDGKKIGNDLFSMSLYQIYAVQFAGRTDVANQQVFNPIGYSGTRRVFQFRFGTNFVLKNGETFRLECTNQDFDGDIFEYTLTTIPTIGLQTFMPVYDVYNLDTNLKKYDLNLGNDVSNVVFLQRELPSALTAPLRCPVIKVQLKSDKINADLSKDDIYLGNVSYDGKSVDDGTPISLFKTGVLLNTCRIVLECNNASPNRQLIVCRAVQTPEIVNNFQSKSAQHNKENLNHVKSNDSLYASVN